MKLIDADKLKAILTDEKYPCVLQDALNGIIDAQPTAYDIDKVLEELEEEKKQGVADWNFYRGKNNRNMADMYDGKINAFIDAIRIVEGGWSQ